ncbi:AAA family ATPase [uncultured Bifidobacterium sp.]|uniref:AAA family ATPase n=1 Tax=uncultured Bifidobacterium sp. TaxID=165187 RepID=UPI0028DD1F67|nr:AAA family ATPase [uncultured Bifidobacterium sp.]
MYLKELTLRGFKSFASATTLRFGPGLTAVVGPNGSGKSNIVDALAWVMGEQGARVLRGTAMEDVIFAGTASRPALGRAQVTLTIDNSDHALDIPYAEVSISRTVFRSGGSEYAINGRQCRLLDVQELLSDTGLGQRMHVIVGQGRLDEILRADPAGNRAFIEEAAGILKHRRRKERALRKLEATQDNLARLDDLIAEIRRQLKPLGRQARMSKRADRVAATLRDAKARIAADDASALRRCAERAASDARDVSARLSEGTRRLDSLRAAVATLEERSTGSDPDLALCEKQWHELSSIAERLRSLDSVATERARSERASITAHPGEDPEILRARAEELGAQASGAESQVAERRLDCDRAVEARAEAERRLAAVRQTITQLRQAAKDREGRETKLRRLVSTEEAAVQVAVSRLADLEEQHERLRRQSDELHADLGVSEQTPEDALRDAEALLEEARALLSRRQEELAEAQRRQREAESSAISQEAKAAALEETLAGRGSSGLSDSQAAALVRGRLSGMIRVSDGWEKAVDRALGALSSSLVVSGRKDALAMAAGVLREESGRLAVIHPREPACAGGSPSEEGDHGRMDDAADSRPCPDGGSSDASASTVPLAFFVNADPEADDQVMAEGIRDAVRGIVKDVAAVHDLSSAEEALRNSRWRVAVTPEGVLVGRVGIVAGTGDAASELLLVSQSDHARRRGARFRRDAAALAQDAERLAGARDEARTAVDARQRELTEVRVRIREERRARESLRNRAREVDRRLGQVTDRRDQTAQEERSHRSRLDDLRHALEKASNVPSGQDADPDELAHRERDLEQSLTAARNHEMEATLAWKDARRSQESLVRQTGLLADEAERAEQRRRRIRERNEASESRARRAEAIAVEARDAAAVADAARDRVALRRDGLREELAGTNERLRALRAERVKVEPEVTRLQMRAHELDLEVQRAAADLDRLAAGVADDVGMGLDELIHAYGPNVPVPVLDDDGNPVPFGPTALHQETVDRDSAQNPAVKGVGPQDAVVQDAAVTHRTGGDADDVPIVQEDGDPDDSDASVIYRTVPYVRAEQERRRDEAARRLQALGKVNPLAAEEYDALEERHRFLVSQRDDVASGRRDLLQLVKGIDSTMTEVFRSAFEDTAAAFQEVFATLFPGGRGRLRLEDPDDLLSSGVLVEASPAGKRVRQLSLLSGGERSLTALALLFAIFTARPSPFYVMDEVEAALDDVNLTRLLEAMKRLREHAQLIVITHQQRTMSIADDIYGVTMRSDGVTTVISQRLADVPGADGSSSGGRSPSGPDQNPVSVGRG